MKRIRYEVLPAWLGWKITRNGQRVAWTLLKSDALSWAIEQANYMLTWHDERSEMIVKGRDGRIQDSSTYGKDPRRSKG